ncbi:MAG: hypothetical protein ACREYC_06750 [Gammaproteobacteria bacterium]
MKGVKDESGTVDARAGAVHCSREGVAPRPQALKPRLEATGKEFLIDTGQESVEKWH